MDLILNSWIRPIEHAAWSDRAGHHALTVTTGTPRIYLSGGYTSQSLFTRSTEVWYTENGVTWSLATATPGWAGRAYHGFLYYNNKFWVFGGSSDGTSLFNDVWSSDDAVTWTQVTASAAWAPRHQFGFCVHNNKMYLCGGYNNVTFFSDVYSSSDGVTWTLETANFGQGLRQLILASFLGDLWIYTGCYGTGSSDNTGNIRRSTNNGSTWSLVGTIGAAREQRYILNDTQTQLAIFGNVSTSVIITTDGINFTSITQVTRSPQRPGRNSYAVANLHNNAYYMGGLSGGVIYNDVWKVDYSIVYNGNGGSPAPSTIYYDPGDTVTVAEPGSLARFAYSFANWNTASNGSGTTYYPNDTFTMTTGFTLYAQWTLDPLSGIFYVEAVGSNIWPFDTREKAATNFTELFNTVPSEIWQPTWVVYVFGEIYEPNEYNWFEGHGIQIRGENPQTTIVNMSTCTFEDVSLYDCSFYTDTLDAEWYSLVYVTNGMGSSDLEVINCRFDGNNIWYEAIEVYSGRPIRIEGNSFENFMGDNNAVYISDNTTFSEILIVNNSFNNCNVYLDIYNTSVTRLHFYNNAIETGFVHIELTSVLLSEFFHDHNISLGGYQYIQDGEPFATDVTETQVDPLFLDVPPNRLAIDNTSPAFHAGITRSTTPTTDLMGLNFADPPSIGAYEVVLPTYTLTYNGNGNTGGTAPVDPTEYTEGDLALIVEPGILEKTDSIFYSWNTSSDGYGTAYFPGSYIRISADTTLYAIWMITRISGFVAKID